MSKDDSSGSISICDVVQEMMDKELGGEEAPFAHRRVVESQKVFTMNLFENLLKRIEAGEVVRIKNFGNFSLRLVKPSARNPKTGEIVEVKNRKRLKFKATKNADDFLNKREG